MNSLEDLSKEDLLFFIDCYNDYVVHFYDEHEEGMQPVCAYEYFTFEFLENEFQDRLNERGENI